MAPKRCRQRRRPRPALPQEAGRKAERKLQARRVGNADLYFWLGMFGLVGWSVALPTLLGLALGLWLDRLWPVRFSWTLTLLVIGVLLGCLNAWHWINRVQRRALDKRRESDD